jgi:hypothetical protein
MSKYALKLEQLVQTDKYGDLLVTIQYDGQGPKLVTVVGDKLQAELKHMLDTVLGLVNFNLTKGIKPNELATQLQVQPEDGIRTPLNDLLLVVASSLEEAPEGVNNIDGGILMNIAEGMVAEFTRSAGASTMIEETAKPSAPMGGRQSGPGQRQGGNPNQGGGNNNPAPQPKPQAQPQQAPAKPQSNEASGEDDKKGGFFGGFRERK